MPCTDDPGLAEIEAWQGAPCEACDGEGVIPAKTEDGGVGPDEPCPFCTRPSRCIH